MVYCHGTDAVSSLYNTLQLYAVFRLHLELVTLLIINAQMRIFFMSVQPVHYTKHHLYYQNFKKSKCTYAYFEFETRCAATFYTCLIKVLCMLCYT